MEEENKFKKGQDTSSTLLDGAEEMIVGNILDSFS